MAAVYVTLPEGLRRYAGGRDRVELEADTARQALDRLFDLHPELRERTVDAAGRLHPYLVLSRNGEQVDPRRLDDVALAAGDRLELLAAASGG